MRNFPLILLFLLLTACGQKGDLYLPDPPVQPPQQEAESNNEPDDENIPEMAK